MTVDLPGSNDIDEIPEAEIVEDDGEEEDDDLDSRAHAQARAVAPTRIEAAWWWVGTTTTTVMTWLAGLVSRYASTADALGEMPMSVRQCIDYTRYGEFVPGEHDAWLEVPGKVYGWALAIPGTAVLETLTFIIQKPTRLFVAALFAAVIWFGAHWVIS